MGSQPSQGSGIRCLQLWSDSEVVLWLLGSQHWEGGTTELEAAMWVHCRWCSYSVFVVASIDCSIGALCFSRCHKECLYIIRSVLPQIYAMLFFTTLTCKNMLIGNWRDGLSHWEYLLYLQKPQVQAQHLHTTGCNFTSRSDTFFWFLQAPAYTCAYIK